MLLLKNRTESILTEHEGNMKREIRQNDQTDNVEAIRMPGHITPCQVQDSSVPEQDLLPAVNKSARPAVSCIYGVEDELGEIESDQEDTAVDDPINSEI